MADEKRRDNRDLLVGGAVAGGAAAGVSYLDRRAQERRQAEQPRKTGRVLERQQQRLSRMREEGRTPPIKKPVHPKKVAAEKARSANPRLFKKQIQGARLAKRAAKASGRGLGVVGMAVGAPSAIESARRIEKEGGTFSARFGKFVEELLGAPPGLTHRPPTEKERKERLSI